jgi:hypothetical protein
VQQRLKANFKRRTTKHYFFLVKTKQIMIEIEFKIQAVARQISDQGLDRNIFKAPKK